jgi:hypothetical protein
VRAAALRLQNVVSRASRQRPYIADDPEIAMDAPPGRQGSARMYVA